jgi:DNA replicative helicase MCM subunit Mcm2 (Cdc46/Mcm family)
MRPIIRCELDPTSSAVRKAQKFLSKKIKQSYSGELSTPLSVRAAGSLKRLSMTSARMRLSPQVEKLDITKAISIMKSSLATWT